MALNTSDTAGAKDLVIPPEVRLYFLAGTQPQRQRSVEAAAVCAQPSRRSPVSAGEQQLVFSRRSAHCWSRCATGSQRERAAGERLPDHRAHTLVPIAR